MTSATEQLLIPLGRSIIGTDSIKVEDYPFEPSSIFRDPEIAAKSILSISLKFRPTIRLVNELISVSAKEKDQLIAFATANKIPIIDDSWVWSWLLEPFLDTEFTEEDKERTDKLLAGYGLSDVEVSKIRAEVKEQMLKYNFDTMLWEWVDLDLFDVLRAMRAKYDEVEFRRFYWESMEIALRPTL